MKHKTIKLISNSSTDYQILIYYILIRHRVSFALPPSISSQPRINIALASCGFRHADPSFWNSHPHHLRSADSYTVFISNLKTHLFSGASIYCR